MLAHFCNPTTREAKAEGLGVRQHSKILSKQKKKKKTRVSKMVQWVEEFAAKPDDLSPILSTHMEEEENKLS